VYRWQNMSDFATNDASIEADKAKSFVQSSSLDVNW